jgi:serine/threonine protein phosphatase PrpC
MPDLVEARIGHTDQIIIVASDGLWEFVTSAEAIKVAAQSEDPAQAVQGLMEKSLELWKENDENIDDTTIIVLFLHGKE